MSEIKNQVDSLKKRIYRAATSRKIILQNYNNLTEALLLTAAVRDLKLSHPDILISVKTNYPELWEKNPYIGEIDENDPHVKIYTVENDLYLEKNECCYHSIHGIRKNIERQLELKIKATRFCADIHIEKTDKNQLEEIGIGDNYWIVSTEENGDPETGKWGPKNYQEIIDYFKEQITFIYYEKESNYNLKNVLNLNSEINLKQLIKLIYYSRGIICPNSTLMHLAAGIESSHNLKSRPCIVIGGGWENPQWYAYPRHRVLSVNGCLECCGDGGCWKKECICPIEIGENLIIPKCMEMIKSEQVIREIEQYHTGEMLKYNDEE